MKVLKVIREKTEITFKHEVKGAVGLETETRVTHEAPLKTFDTSLQKLVTPTCYILGTGQQWGDEIVIKSLTISYTTKGTRSAKIGFVRTLSATEKDHPMDTPMFQFDEPADGEEQKRECDKRHAEAIDKFITEAEKYASGDRLQILLDLPKNEPKKPAKDKNQAELPGVED